MQNVTIDYKGANSTPKLTEFLDDLNGKFDLEGCRITITPFEKNETPDPIRRTITIRGHDFKLTNLLFSANSVQVEQILLHRAGANVVATLIVKLP